MPYWLHNFQTNNEVNMNLCIRKEPLPSVVPISALEMTQIECAAIETLAEARFQIDNLTRIIDNANFALCWLNASDDKKSVVDILELEKSCESLIAKIDGDLTPEAAVEGVGEALLRAWEAIKAWVKKVFTAIFNLVAAIFGADTTKKVHEESEDIKDAAPKAKDLAEYDYKDIKCLVHGEVAKARVELEMSMDQKLLDSYKAVRDSFTAYQTEFNTPGTARLDERTKFLKEKLEEHSKLLDEYKSKIEELEKKNAGLCASAGTHAMKGWDPATMKAFAEAYEKLYGPNGSRKKLAEEISRTEPVIKKAEKALDEAAKTAKNNNGSSKPGQPPPSGGNKPPAPPSGQETKPAGDQKKDNPNLFAEGSRMFSGSSRASALEAGRLKDSNGWFRRTCNHIEDCAERVARVMPQNWSSTRYAARLNRKAEKADIKEAIREVRLILDGIATGRPEEVMRELEKKNHFKVPIDKVIKTFKQIIKTAVNAESAKNYIVPPSDNDLEATAVTIMVPKGELEKIIDSINSDRLPEHLKKPAQNENHAGWWKRIREFASGTAKAVGQTVKTLEGEKDMQVDDAKKKEWEELNEKAKDLKTKWEQSVKELTEASKAQKEAETALKTDPTNEEKKAADKKAREDFGKAKDKEQKAKQKWKDAKQKADAKRSEIWKYKK